jgi:hypothetical protein
MHSPAMPLVALQEPGFCEETQGIAVKAANTTMASRIVLDAGCFCTQALWWKGTSERKFQGIGKDKDMVIIWKMKAGTSEPLK